MLLIELTLIGFGNVLILHLFITARLLFGVRLTNWTFLESTLKVATQERKLGKNNHDSCAIIDKTHPTLGLCTLLSLTIFLNVALLAPLFPHILLNSSAVNSLITLFVFRPAPLMGDIIIAFRFIAPASVGRMIFCSI